MDIKKYELFVNVAETGNFTKSADQCGYTQSGVSHLLKSLENEIGFALFTRSKQGVTLTPNAEMLLPLVRSLLADNAKIEQTIHDINGCEVGRIRIGTFTSIAISWLPQILHQFEKAHPNIKLTIKEGGTDELREWIETRTIDLALTSGRHMGMMEFIPLYEDPLVAVLPKDHPNAMLEEVPLQHFHKKPFIISSFGTDYDIHYALSDAKVKPKMQYSCSDDHAIVAMVANHLGISVLPKLSVQNYEASVCVRPLSPSYSRILGIGYHSKEQLTPASKKFLNYASEYIQSHFAAGGSEPIHGLS